jgi:drug/metabolite transporter (DMT)-like permease
MGPVATIAQTYVFPAEPVTWPQLIGTAPVLTGVLLTGWKGKGAKKINERSEIKPAAR